MIEFLLILLLLLLVGVFGCVLGVHLQAAKSKTDCGCGKGSAYALRRLQRLEALLRDKPKEVGDGNA